MSTPAPGDAPRAAVLLPAPGRLEDAAQRVSVRGDGALVHTTAAKGTTSERVLLGPGELTHAWLIHAPVRVGRVELNPARGDWVLLAGGARSVALSVPGWTPGQPTPHPDALAVSGMRAVIAALGHALPETFDLDVPDVEALRRLPSPIVVDPRPRSTWRRRPDDLPLQAMRAIILLLIVLWVGEGFTKGPGDESTTRYPEPVLVGLGVLIALPLLSILVAPWMPRRRPRDPRPRRGEDTVAPGSWSGPGGLPRIEARDAGTWLLVVTPRAQRQPCPGRRSAGS